MQTIFYYLSLGFLFTHELDAMTNHEWRVLPGLSSLDEATGQMVFVLMHIPLFALIIWLGESRFKSLGRVIITGFLVIHAGLHLAFSGHEAYEFSTAMSSFLIYGGAAVGAVYLFLRLARR